MSSKANLIKKFSFFIKNKTKFILVFNVIGIVLIECSLIISMVSWKYFLGINLFFIIFEIMFNFLSKDITPYQLFGAAPLIFLHFYTVEDFLIRLFCFIFFSYFFIFLIYNFRLRYKVDLQFKKIFLIYLIWLILLSFIFYKKGVFLSGDEPHYLIITQSLVEDGDFNLENNYNEKTYLMFHPAVLQPHAYKHNGKLLSFHLPGVSFVLLPFFYFYEMINKVIPPQLYFRLSVGIINSVFVILLCLILKNLIFVRNKKWFFLFLILIFPVSIHSIHIYPEIPSATFVLASIYYGFIKNSSLLFGLFISTVVWFHIKYIPLIFVIVVFFAYKNFKNGNFNFLKYMSIFPLFNFFLFSFYLKTQYGFFNPIKVFPKGNFFRIPIRQIFETFIAFFLDQRDGIIFYSPIYFIFFYSILKARSIKKDFKILMIMSLFVYLFFHSITTIRGAYAPSGRPIVFVIWIIIFYVISIYNENNVSSKFVFKVLLSFTILFNLIIILNPLFVYQPVISSTVKRSSALFDYLGSDNLEIYKFFPSFLKAKENYFYLANYFWIGVIIFIFIFSKFNIFGRIFFKKFKLVLIIIFYTASLLLLSFNPHVRKGFFLEGKNVKFWVNSKNFIQINGEKFRLLTNKKYNLIFLPEIYDRKTLRLRFILRDGKARIKISSGLKTFYQFIFKKNIDLHIDVYSLNKVKIKDKFYPYLTIEIEKIGITEAVYLSM